MTLGELIKEYRTIHDLSMDEFAKKAKISKAYISILERNYNPASKNPPVPSLATIKAVSVAIGKDFNEVIMTLGDQDVCLFGVNDESPREIMPDNLFRIETKKFPLLGNIACGEPIFADEEKELYVEAGANVHADFCLRAKGDSMTGARIQDGDIVFIKKQEMVDNGEIAAVLIEDEATLKRVYYDQENKILQLFAENPKFKTMRFSGEELNHVRILGKAIAFQSDIK